MAFLRPQNASRVLRAASTSRLTAAAPVRLSSSLSQPADTNPLVPQSDKPDYNIPADKATS